MFLLNRRLFFLVLLCGASAFGIYRTSLHYFQCKLTKMLAADSTVEMVSLSSNALVSAAKNIDIAQTDHASLSIGQLRLQPNTNGQGYEKAIASQISLNSQDDWSKCLKTASDSIADIDPDINAILLPQPVDFAAAMDHTVAPLLAGWRSEWQTVLASYQRSIDTAVVPVIPEEDLAGSRSNPLRDRKLLELQIESITKLNAEFERIQRELDSAKERLAKKSESVSNIGRTALEKQLNDQEQESRRILRERITRNLEAIRGLFYAELLNTILPAHHTTSNIALRCSQSILGDYSVTSDRGVDILKFMPDTSATQIDSLELSGKLARSTAGEAFIGALYRKKDVLDAWADFLVVFASDSKTPKRFTGRVEPDGKCTYAGKFSLSNFRVDTDLLTEPNFVVQANSLDIAIQSLVDLNEQDIKMKISIPQVILDSMLNAQDFQTLFEGQAIVQNDCQATLTVQLRKDGAITYTTDHNDDFFSIFHKTAIERINQLQSSVPGQMAKFDEALRSKIETELALANSSLSMMNQQLASQRDQHRSRAQIIAQQLTPNEFRTATGNTGSPSNTPSMRIVR